MKNRLTTAKSAAPTIGLLQDVRELILTARQGVARAVNVGLVMLYWRGGKRTLDEVLGGQRAEYGEEIVSTLSKQLTAEFGHGFSKPNLSRMVNLVETFPDPEILSTLSTKLNWSHFVEILPLKDKLKQEFYAEMCRVENWSVRTLRQKIDGMLFERAALSRKTDKLIEQELQKLRVEDQLSPDLVFRDPYFLDFLGLKGAFSEKDLEIAILRDLERFVVELGGDFAFLARQKRIVVDGEDFYLDLLFYHRQLRRLVAIDLKLGRFVPGDVGQMEFYLRWVKKNEMRPEEAEPIGLILCAEKSDERIELLELESRGIRVAEYLTELPPRKLLERKLHEAVRLARARLEQLGQTESEASPALPAKTKRTKR